ncbi:MAG: Hpt domain-containing protein [Planctomycetota bacterium]|nr:Hpt domain-containing protein [Planctomycetota bacterium]
MESTQAQTALEPAIYDRKALLQQLDGDESIVRELEGSFAGDWPEYEATLREAARGGDAKGMEWMAHKVKGSLRVFHAQRAAEWAERIEHYGRQGRAKEACLALPALCAEVGLVLQAFQDARG